MGMKNESYRYKLFMCEDVSVIKIFTLWLKHLHTMLIYWLCNYIRYTDEHLREKRSRFLILLIIFLTFEHCISISTRGLIKTSQRKQHCFPHANTFLQLDSSIPFLFDSLNHWQQGFYSEYTFMMCKYTTWYIKSFG